MNILPFQINVPAEVTLERPEGTLVQGRYGDRVMFTLADGRIMYVPPFVASKIQADGVAPGDRFQLCKTQVRNGNRRSIEWTVRRLDPSEPTAETPLERVMLRQIATVLFGLIACLAIEYQVGAQQAPPSAAQPTSARGRGPAAPVPPPLFFKETWHIVGPAHAIAPDEVVVTNPNLELKLYGPSATASDPDKRIWISGPPGPPNIWTGMCATPFAAALRDKNNYVNLTGLAKVRWLTRASGFHAVRPLIKLAHGTFLIGDHADASTTTFLESEFAFAGLRWMKLDIDRVVTVGSYGPVGEASNWAAPPDLSKVDEVGFVDLIPGSGHGSGVTRTLPRLRCTEPL